MLLLVGYVLVSETIIVRLFQRKYRIVIVIIILYLLYLIRLDLGYGWDALEALRAYMGPHFMLLLSIYVLYSNVTYIYPVSCLVEIHFYCDCYKGLRYTIASLLDRLSCSGILLLRNRQYTIYFYNAPSALSCTSRVQSLILTLETSRCITIFNVF